MPAIPYSLLIILNATPIVKYGLLFLLVVVEGPLMTMGAGLLVPMGYLHPVDTYIVVVAAELVSDSCYYALGYWGRTKTVAKFSKYFSAEWPKLLKLEDILRRRAELVLIGGKLTHLAGVPVLVAAGLAKMNFRKFLTYDTIATIPKSLTFLVIGYYFGKFTAVINQYLEYGTYITLGMIVLAVVGYISLGRRIGKKILS